jgi:hypothetical protein
MMRKVLFASMLSVLCLTTAMAQGLAICGDWIGVYHGWDIEDVSKRKYHSIDYDRNMNYKGEEDYNASLLGVGTELDLFNDDW